eukprot:CAMPEP_0194385686 /NCGR_PEP_ID=MMETSP0174-20130528/81936_1 /TAXON_ID=216777 /ORGANISM="Proboscia alata, Strain PI-D3" /LENGTH=35 /DNA_ID= /DNA_START= /DNA_END= /DNA_ORIENTATION=
MDGDMVRFNRPANKNISSFGPLIVARLTKESEEFG